MDLRLIIGRLFVAIGALLLLAAYFVPASTKSQFFGANLNLAWGVVLLATGAVFSFATRKP